MLMPDGLTSSGLTFLIAAWSVITGLVTFCFWKILRTRNNDRDR